MNIHYTARQIELTPDIKAYCERRLARLKGLIDDIIGVNIILTLQKNRRIAEVHLRAKGGGISVSEETPDIMDSLNAAFDHVERKVRKERAKWREKKRRGGRERKTLAVEAEGQEPEKRIIRANHYSLKPMSLEEALVQVDLKNREVFMFRREGSDGWAVVFRRKDGHYGLIVPE